METATHIGIREAEDWFRPIDLAKECDIYFHLEADHIKKFLLLMDIPKTPLKIDHKTLNQRLKRTIPNILKENIKIALYAVIHLITQETILLSGLDEKTYRCGQRTVRLADCGSQSKESSRRRS
ncbi:hypothetical protein TNCV_4607761 [Trichonephila clavipes]|nr:hypothetical protein TNCV_4607761 [Trichonephila clavipes]